MKEKLVVFYAIKNFIKKDFCSERINLVNDYLDANISIRYVYQSLESLSSVWLVIFAILSSRPTSLFSFNNNVCLWKNQNEFNSFNKYKYFYNFSKINYKTFSITLFVDIMLNIYLFFSNYKKIKIITDLIHRKDIPYYVKLRTSQMLFDYIGFRNMISRFNQRFEIVISTEGQPFSYALFALCKKGFCSVHFVAHAYYVNNPQKIIVDNFYTLNDYLYQTFSMQNSEINERINIGRNRNELKKVEKFSFLIALSKSFNKNYIYHFLNSLDSLNQKIDVIVRYHPSNILHEKLIVDSFKNLVFLNSQTKSKDFTRTNITVGGASNILFDSVVEGNYTFYDEKLDNKVNEEITFVNYFPILDLSNIDYSIEMLTKSDSKNNKIDLLLKV